MSFCYEKGKVYPRLDKWLLINTLGDGATSNVFLAYEPLGRRYAAIKIFKSSDSKSIAEAKREARLQTSLKHPLIVGVEEFYESVTLTETDGETRMVGAIVLELAKGGDLLLLVKRVEVVPEKLARTYFRQIIEVIEYLHNKKIAHRDIKLENLTLDGDFCIKLTDFGCSTQLSLDKGLPSVAGTSKYFPPELHSEKAYDAAGADIFASGVVLFCLMCGTMPFKKAEERDYLYNLLMQGKTELFWKGHEEISKKKSLKINLSPEFKYLINRMLDPDPLNRLSIEEIKKNAWYQQSVYERSEVKEIALEIIN